MSTAEQYRAKALEYKGLLDHPHSSAETNELRNREQTFTTLADNEEWMARNSGKVVSPTQYDIGPASQTDRNQRPVPVGEHEHVLRCLGAAVMMRWHTLPMKLQRELFDIASSVGDFDPDDSASELEQRTKLKGRIARALHHHKGGETQ